MTNDLRNLLIRHEGRSKKPYKDSLGKITIGCGRCLDTKGLSDTEIDYLLTNDIKEVINLMSENFEVYNELDPVRQDVLASMCFNVGLKGISEFRRMWAAISRHDYIMAANEMLTSAWSAQVGKRAVELADMMRSGVYGLPK